MAPGGFTLKASHNSAQGQRSGAAAKRHPGFPANRGFPTRNGLQKFLWNPYRVRSLYRNPQPRVALRLPWATIWNRFAVKSQGAMPTLVVGMFSHENRYMATRAVC